MVSLHTLPKLFIVRCPQVAALDIEKYIPVLANPGPMIVPMGSWLAERNKEDI